MKTLKTLTWSDFKKHSPCYDPLDKYGYFEGTILDILKDDRIPAQDRIWAFCQKGMVSEKSQRLFACKCVRDTPLPDGRKVWDLLTDEASKNAVIVSEKFAHGKATAEELRAARWEARAGWEAALDESWEASWEAALDESWEAQIKFAIDIIKEYE